MDIKSRKVVVFGSPSYYHQDNGPINGTTPRTYGHYQWTQSEGHPWRPSAARSGEDVGGPFHTKKVTVEEPTVVSLSRKRFGVQTTYTGPVWPRLSIASQLTVNEGNWEQFLSNLGDPSSSDNALDVAGTTAISRTIPTNPNADAAVAIIELFREGLPSLVGSQILSRRRSSPRDAAGEYLNWEFGIKPILSDLERVYQASLKAEEILLQLERDSGKLIRRKYRFPIEETVDEEVKHKQSCYIHPVTSGTLQDHGTLTTRKRTTTTTWFSGAYRYAVPERASMSKLQEFRYLYGLTLDPSVVWEVVPWSWLVDWFSSTGDVIHNISALARDGLVLQYGYIMRNTRIEYTDTWVGPLYRGSGWVTTRVSQSYFVETKQRRPATPFGFGLDVSTLSPRQLAILTSIGLTR